MIDKTCLCPAKFLAIPGSPLIYSEILLLQTRLLAHRDSCFLADMTGGFCCTHQWRIKNLINCIAALSDHFAGSHRLLMSQRRQRNIRGTADLIFHIPEGLSMSRKI